MRAVLAACLLVACLGGCEDAEGARDRVRAASLTSRDDARSAWVRVTPEGLGAIPGTLHAAAGGTPPVRIGRRREGQMTVCTGGDCELTLELSGASISPRAQGDLGLSVSVAAASTPIGVRYEQSWACAFTGRPECEVSVDTGGAPPPVLTARAVLAPHVDEGTGIGGFVLRDPAVAQGIDGGDLSIRGTNSCGRVWCSVANLVGAQRWIAGEANGALTDAIRREVDSRTCLPCDAGCPDGSRCDGGICRAGRGAACVPVPLAASATLESGNDSAATLAVALGDVVEVRRGGLDAAIRLGARPTEQHRCVPAADAPPHAPLPREALGEDGEAHVRVALSQAALARAAWALHQAGLGCRDITPADVPQLSAAMIAIVLPSTMKLAPLGLDAPQLAVRPLRPPTVRVEDDGGVRIEVADLRLDVEAVVDGRLLRLASGTLSASAVARVESEDGTPVLAISPDEVSVEVTGVWSSPLLGAPDEELLETFDALGSIARGAVPERVPLELPVPVALEVVATRGMDADGTRALLVDLRAEPRP